MKRLVGRLLAAAALVAASAVFATATPMDDLKKDGYSCERGGVDSIVCTKSGAPTRYCDNAGNCTRTAGGKSGVTGIDKVTGAKAAEKKKSGVKGAAGGMSQVGSAELTSQECERLGGVVTSNSDPNCKSNQRCKTTLSNGDIRSICIDEVAQ